jgi:phosphate transport system protein
MGPIRQIFSKRITALEERTLGALELVDAAIATVSDAVQRQDAALAATVIDGDDVLDRRYLEVKHGLLTFMATQAPVATDLRLAAALLAVIGHVERMGDQCVNIAKRIPFGGSPPAEAAAMLEGLAEMAALASALSQEAKAAFAARDPAAAEAIVTHDDELNALNRRAFDLAAAAGGGPPQHEWAMQMMLTARWFERIGDHAVDIGEEAAFVVTGDFREFSDASHPGGVRRAS